MNLDEQVELESLAIKAQVVNLITTAMRKQKVNKTGLAKLMNTSRSSIDRLLDVNNSATTMTTISKCLTKLDVKFTIGLK